MLNLIHIIGQILFGGYFIWSGVNHFVKHKDLSAYAASNKVPMPGTAVYITGIMLIIGGLGMLFNLYTLIALIILVVFIIPVSFAMHPFWKGEPGVKSANIMGFMKNMALLGAMLLLMQW